MRHILVPVGRARRDERAMEKMAEEKAATSAHGRALRPLPRGLLRGLLAVYAVIQYVWKLVQWLIFTPLLMAMLVLLSVLRVLSFIGIVRSALIASFSALSGYVMLHWIASTQVYMRDYALAATMRQRFEREVTAFLRDERCDRVVVIAHSMGTVIAYEGLTTLLGQFDLPGAEKPLTFICLAQALRRVWLLPGIDTRRLHGVLPERVRWIHYWAPYDLVAVGPLEPRTLPTLKRWLVGIPLALAAFASVFVVLRVVIGVAPVLPDDVLTLALVPFAAALVYALWSDMRHGASKEEPTAP